MKGFYFVHTNVLNTRAHSIQVVKTADALAQEGVNLTIVAPRFLKNDTQSMLDTYNISNNLNIKFYVLWRVL